MAPVGISETAPHSLVAVAGIKRLTGTKKVGGGKNDLRIKIWEDSEILSQGTDVVGILILNQFSKFE